jgi:hypothetical protein
MASKEECDKYAAELTRRFDEMVRWALANWPKQSYKLVSSDFSESRREISRIVGAKLGDPEDGGDISAAGKKSAPYLDMNPMPWP